MLLAIEQGLRTLKQANEKRSIYMSEVRGLQHEILLLPKHAMKDSGFWGFAGYISATIIVCDEISILGIFYRYSLGFYPMAKQIVLIISTDMQSC